MPAMSSASVAVTAPSVSRTSRYERPDFLRKIAVADRKRRDHEDGRERELPGEDEEDHRRAAERERVLDQRGEAVGDELVERFDVVRQPADQDAGAVALVEAEREALQVAEEVVAEVGQHPLARPAGEVGLGIRADDADQARRDERDHDQVERAAAAAADDVDRHPDQDRRRERGGGGGEQRDDRERRPAAVGPREPVERRQPPPRRRPRPVVDLDVAVGDEAAPGLPDPHGVTLPSPWSDTGNVLVNPLQEPRLPVARGGSRTGVGHRDMSPLDMASKRVMRPPARRRRPRSGRARRSRGRRRSPRAPRRGCRGPRSGRARGRRSRRRARSSRPGAR